MCGIAGIIHFDGRPVLQTDLKKMTDAIAHRGPDGEGFFVDGNIGFGHRRLAIIDLSDAGSQPMTRFGYTITYNGEIYNYIELKLELEKLGYNFLSHSDTEVILAAYHRWGKDCVSRFNGMWAFAIYDAANKQVFLSRDRFGEKPLYYSNVNGSFIFCSGIAGLHKVMSSKVGCNEAMLARFLIWETAEHNHETFFKSVEKLPSAHSMTVHLDSSQVQLTSYYAPAKPTEPFKEKAEEANGKALLQMLQNAVALRLRSDVEVGTCLSGGLDSSTIAAIASAQHVFNKGRTAFRAITAGSINDEADERKYAQIVAEHCKLQWNTIVPTADSLRQLLSQIIQVQEEPVHSPSVAMQYMVMETAHKAGLKVMLDGQGADELFLGYKTHLIWALRNMRANEAMENAKKCIGNYQITYVEFLSLFYHANTFLKRKMQLNKWRNLPATLLHQLKHELAVMPTGKECLFNLQNNELFKGTLPMLLRYEDKNAMAFGVETRLPFLDPEIVDYALSLPAQAKVHNGWSKHILRNAANDLLPQSIIWRKGKMAFDAPKGSYHEMIDFSLLQQATQRLFPANQLFKGQSASSLEFRFAALSVWLKQNFC